MEMKQEEKCQEKSEMNPLAKTGNYLVGSVRVTGGCKTKIEALLPKCVRTDMFVF